MARLPAAVKEVSRLPDLTQVNGFAYGENDLILDAKAPMPSARRLLGDRYTIDASQLLYHHRGEFCVWTGTHYVEISDQFITSDIYHFLEYAKLRTKKTLERFEPNRARVGEIQSALKAATHLSDVLNPPIWLDHAPDLEAREIISCENGLLHLPTRSMLPHTPAFYTHNAIDYSYHETAPSPEKWLAFLKTLWPDDQPSIDALQEWFGYCLVSDTSQQKAMMLVGPKRSGKGTIARILEATLGPYNAVSPTLASLGTNFGLAPLVGKRIAIISDARIGGRTDTAMVAERLLSITGEDSVSVDRKFLSNWNGKLEIKFLVLSNELPRIADASGALPSRFIVLVLTNSFFGREDRGLTRRLLAERPGILNWSIIGYERLIERGYFLQPASANDAIHDLEDLGSPIGAFIRDRCLIEPGRCMIATTLFEQWQGWCSSQGRAYVGTVQAFGRDLRAAVPGIKIARPREGGIQVRTYEGICLKPSWEVD